MTRFWKSPARKYVVVMAFFFPRTVNINSSPFRSKSFMVPFTSIALANGLCLRVQFKFLFGVSLFAIHGGAKKQCVLQGCGSGIVVAFVPMILGIRLGSKELATENTIIRGSLFLLSMIRRR